MRCQYPTTSPIGTQPAASERPARSAGGTSTWHDATTPIGTALRIVPRFHVTAEDDHTRVGTTLDVEYGPAEGRYLVRTATTWSLSGAEITANELRQVRVAEIAQLASPRCVAFTLDGDDTAGELITAADVSASGSLLPEWLSRTITSTLSSTATTAQARAELREARLDAVQLVYGVAALTGQPPAKAIERELGMQPRTATHWISQARRAGRLDGLGYAVGRPHHG